jgi:long-chain acyl-CoA synthetase
MHKRIVAAIEEKRVASLLIKPMSGVASLAEALGARGVRKKLFHAVHEKFGGALRILIVGAASPSPEVGRGMRSLGFTFIQGYGLTETSPIVALNRLRKFRDDAAGLPLPGLEVRIVDPDEDGRGEILVRGPSVMLGYYKNEEATRRVLKDGWFATGDYGHFDVDGFLHISGRKKNVIVASNGKNVFPEELEDHVNAIPFVLESAVYGAKGANGNEEICVMVVPNAETFLEHAEKTRNQLTRGWIENVLDQEIRALNRTLPLYKQIRRVRVKDSEFEKTTSMKIKRYLLHQEDTTTDGTFAFEVQSRKVKPGCAARPVGLEASILQRRDCRQSAGS